MRLVDTHSHLYLKDFEDIDDVIARARESGVERIYLPNIDSTVVSDMIELEDRYPGNCFAMMGLHPCSVKENYPEELRLVHQWLNKRKFAAVGEIGLDFYWDKTFIKEQYESLERQIKWALEFQLPIVIHSRESLKECIEIVRRFQKGALTGVFHCFTGSEEQAKEIMELGFFLGIGGVVTYKNSGLAQVLEKIGLDHIVLETDSPYLTPVPYRGKRNESSYIKFVVEKIAEIRNITQVEVALITTANAEKLFGV